MQLIKIPWIYILALAGLVFVIPGIKKKLNQSTEFFGLAENQVRSYTRSNDVLIQKLFVKLGQEVKIGDTLMVFHPKNLYFKKEDLASQSRLENIRQSADQFLTQSSIQRLKESILNLKQEYQIKFNKLDEQKRIADSLTRLVTTLPVSDKKYELEKSALVQLRDVEIKQIQDRITELESNTYKAPNTTAEKLSNISTEVNRVLEQEKELILIADMNGIVGQLDYQTGDPVSAYQSIIKIYSTHPTLVTAYIGEQYLGAVTLQDSVLIGSVTDPAYELHGKILNLGSRITTLPDRLKKIPELKTWGRELQIEIPADNHFIQGEKVTVKFLNSN